MTLLPLSIALYAVFHEMQERNSNKVGEQLSKSRREIRIAWEYFLEFVYTYLNVMLKKTKSWIAHAMGIHP